MDNLSGYAHRPLPFVLRYLRQRLAAHVVILVAVVAAVACSVGTQYGVKYLVDCLTAGPARAGGVWLAFVFLMSLIAADNFLWRIASWTASFTFVGVTGDLRRDIFRHLTGHAPSYFSDRLPGMLTSRITATSNAVFTVENMFVWNVLPPCIATVAAIALISTVSPLMAGGLIVVAGAMVIAMFHLAAAGRPLHDDFANKAAAVDGEMVDVINNMPLVRAFCGFRFEHERFDETVNRELTARGRSLRYLEKLRITHAAITVALTIALLAWVIVLWQRGGATTGDVVLVCTLGLSILSATRDLAVALVDVTQHAGIRQVQPPPQCRSKGWARWTIRRWEIHCLHAVAEILRRQPGPHFHRWPEHFPGHPREPSRGDFGGAAGHLDVSPLDHGKYSVRTANRYR